MRSLSLTGTVGHTSSFDPDQNDPVRDLTTRHDSTTKQGNCQTFDVEFGPTSTLSDCSKWLLYQGLGPLIALTREKYRLLIDS